MAKAPPGPDFSRVAAEVRKRLGSFGDVTGLLALVGFTGIVGTGLYKSVYFVDGGCRAVKFNAITGMKDKTYGEGANFAIPFLETPVVFDIRNKPTEVMTATGSRDLQTVNLAVRVLYQPSVNNLSHVYRNLGMEYAEIVLPSLVNEIIRAVIAQFNASDLLVKRPEVSHRIAVMLAERAKRFYVDITDVSITQMSFGKEYTSAVEAKQVAQQMAERAKWRVEQAEQEKKGAILLAEGEAEAAKLIGDAVQKNPAFITLRSLEASRAIAKMMRKHGAGTFYLDSSGLTLNANATGGEGSADVHGRRL
ncbi:prohibitin, putative [Trypanosoma cruzi]|uniref:Prohibitin n=2 Tax=Trypanosoma cruzi TaxID=5693 RepID=V5DJR3_TRYCR|nr:prohibitin, putative [Trypanosoma cruzi]ESS67646.1 prohibitin [Trypanosoma cruzi Dm28c]PBJ69498.1 prohibitin [Trypanosoma cruzi cruzi]KAF8279996.1 putative prohibitin [Trypanosoma cruzi]PWU89974.1 putative prohibitin [Trypanosoma cruzi]